MNTQALLLLGSSAIPVVAILYFGLKHLIAALGTSCTSLTLAWPGDVPRDADRFRIPELLT